MRIYSINENVMRWLHLSRWRRGRLQCALAAVLVAVILTGCAGALYRAPGKADTAYKVKDRAAYRGKDTGAQSPKNRRATYRVKTDIRYRGVPRTYLVHLPPDYDANRPLPLVVLLHGAFGTARSMERSSGFSQLADEKKFIAVYPNGIGIMGKYQHWNAGHCCAEAVKENIDDVGFLKSVIEDVCRSLSVNKRRIYMVGFSNGGMLAYRFAAEEGNMLAGFAPLGASAGGRPDMDSPEWSIPKPVKPLPMIALHGLADKDVPFGGGKSKGSGAAREYWPVIRSLKVWVDRDGCTGAPIKSDQRQGKVHVSTWKNCKGNNKIVLYTLEGWPHLWPGSHSSAKLAPENPLYNFDAARIIWEFFESSSR